MVANEVSKSNFKDLVTKDAGQKLRKTEAGKYRIFLQTDRMTQPILEDKYVCA